MGRSKSKPDVENIGSAFETYIDEKVMENKALQRVHVERSARPTSWGHFLESYAFAKLSINQKLVSSDRLYHPYLAWSGIPDTKAEDEVGDIKNPYTLKSFFSTIEALEGKPVEDWPEALKQENKEWYWQGVSNCILAGVKKFRLILHMPYEEEIQGIQNRAANLEGEEQHKYAWIFYAVEEELPSLKIDGYYEDLYQWQMTIPEDDIEFLTARVTKADKLLKERLNH